MLQVIKSKVVERDSRKNTKLELEVLGSNPDFCVKMGKAFMFIQFLSPSFPLKINNNNLSLRVVLRANELNCCKHQLV